MKITKRQAWYLAVFWALLAGGSLAFGLGPLVGRDSAGLFGLATFAALMSVAGAVQFDE